MEENANETASLEVVTPEQPAQAPQEEQPTGTDWKAEARKWEARSKENAAKLRELTEAREQEATTAADLAEATKRAEQAEAEVATLKHAANVAEWKAQAAAQYGIPANIIKGETAEEIAEHAAAIRAAVPAYVSVRESGEPAGKPATREQILAIKDSKQRLAAIRDNIELFER